MEKEMLTLEDDPLWYKDAIIYELHVKAFYDSNGDGIGDFRGADRKTSPTSRTWESPPSGFCPFIPPLSKMTDTISRIILTSIRITAP